MATEGTMRLASSSGPGTWPVIKDAAGFSTTSNNLAPEDLGLLLGGQRYHGIRNSGGPSRSGSAPPSMEGSNAALNFVRNLSNFKNKFEGLFEAAMFLPEDQLRAHPAYFAYYCANVKMNPRLPPPLTSEEFFHNANVAGDCSKLSSFDCSSKASLFVPRPPLPTHREEAEDEKSPRTEIINSADQNYDEITGQSGLSLQGQHKNLVDLIQEDFPRTPSPVYNVHARPPSHTTTHAVPGTLNPLKDSSIQNFKPETGSLEGRVHTPDQGLHSMRTISHSDASALSEPCTPSSKKTGTSYSNPKADSDRGGACSELDIIEREMSKCRISNDSFRSQHTQQNSQHIASNLRGSSSRAQIGQANFIPQAGYSPQTIMDHLGHGQLNLPLSEVQPVLQSTATAITSPLYAMPASYGAPFYSNLQTPNSMSPQCGLGGYTASTSIVSPLLSGFPSQHTATPVPVEAPANQNFGVRAPEFSTGGLVIPSIDMYKAYGQPGISFLPSYPYPFDSSTFFPPPPSSKQQKGPSRPLQIPENCPFDSSTFFPPPPSSKQQKGPARPLHIPENCPFDSSTFFPPPPSSKQQKGPAPPLHVPECLPQVLWLPGKGGPVNSNYYDATPNIGVFMQYPNSPVASPFFQGSTTAGSGFPGRGKGIAKFPFSSGRGAPRVWQGNRGREKVEDPKAFSFLEELRSNKARHYEVTDISGRIAELSSDQHGSRFIQQKLETCSEEEKALVFKEIMPCASSLITDVFGNYVIQKFFEHGSPEQRRELANKLAGNILSLSLQMYGCRVIQKALEVIELDQKMQLVQELDGHVMRCVQDQNGNHVIQKCIECVPTGKISFIISAFRGQVATLSAHPYGCRVIQRLLEHCTDENQSQCIVDEVLKSACVLADDQYGNYVTQHVLERGKPHERTQIINKLAGQVVQMSQHKYASNVIEKCLQCGNSSEKELLIEEILEQTEGNDNLLIMMKDQYANYVVQKILDISTGKQHEILLNRIKVHLQAMKKYTYGKHIAARVEQLYGEDEHAPD